jgi:hypothetical protein
MPIINPAILYQQAQAQAPGQTIPPQSQPANVAKGRKTPKGAAKSAAQSVYPNLANATNGGPAQP